MSYSRINWQNTPSVSTPLNSENLNIMDKGIKDIDTEIANARVDTNGNTYSSLGDSIRGQVTDLSKVIDGNLAPLANNYGHYVNSAGSISSSAASRCTDYIDISDCIEISMNIKAGQYMLTPSFVLFDANKTFVKSINKDTSGVVFDSTTGDLSYKLSTSELASCKYARFNVSNYAADDSTRRITLIKYGFLDLIKSFNIMSADVGNDLNVSGADMFNLAPNKIYYKYSNNYTLANAPYSSWTGVAVVLQGIEGFVSGKVIIASTLDRRLFFTTSSGSPEVYQPWVEILSMDRYNNMIGHIGDYVGSITSGTQLNTGIVIGAGETVCIVKNKPLPLNDNLNVFVVGDTTNFQRLQAYKSFVNFTNKRNVRAYLVLYGSYTGNVDISVYKYGGSAYKEQQEPKTYIVSKDSKEGDFTSITECFLALKDDLSPKTIIIEGGDYDIFQEYKDANVPVYTGSSPATEYFDYCVWVPQNTHIIGQGRVRMMWMPNPTDNPEITWQQCYAVSPLNVCGNAVIENIEIHCKNGRYCIHNDTMSMVRYSNQIQKFVNVRCYKFTNDTDSGNHGYGTPHVIGYGNTRRERQEYHNCKFINKGTGRAFYGHTNANWGSNALAIEDSGQIILNNCVLQTEGSECVKLGISGSASRQYNVDFNSCYFSGRINIINEGSGDPLPNCYKATFLNCGEVTVHVADPNNTYPPEGYNTVINTV